MRIVANNEGGFTLAEVLIATIVLMVCLVAIAQLVPASLLSNSSNRNDSTAMVFAQQELNQFVGRPITDTQYTTDSVLFLCTVATPCSLGDSALPGQTIGSPVVVIDSHPVIDFSATPVNGYSFTYQDQNDPVGVVYDVRWAVITQAAGGSISIKRFILGATKRGGNSFYVPITHDTIVSSH